jgi:hypothetical protein
LYTSEPIDASLAELDKLDVFAIRTKHTVANGMICALRLAYARLQNKALPYTADEAAESMTKASNLFSLAHLRIFQLMAQYVLDDDHYDHVMEYAQRTFDRIIEAEKLCVNVESIFCTGYFVLFDTLLLIRIIPLLKNHISLDTNDHISLDTKNHISLDTKNQTEQLMNQMYTRITQDINRMEIWSELCPINWRNKLLLMKAEYAALEGRKWDALDLYYQSIEQAGQSLFYHEQALANECAMKFMLANNKEDMAKRLFKV